MEIFRSYFFEIIIIFKNSSLYNQEANYRSLFGGTYSWQKKRKLQKRKEW